MMTSRPDCEVLTNKNIRNHWNRNDRKCHHILPWAVHCCHGDCHCL